MARSTNTNGELRHTKHRGVHSKNNQSKNKASKNYVKPYRGQGR